MLPPPRKHLRWQAYDYRQNGAYFVTLCVHRTHRHKNVFGCIQEREMHLNRFGRLVESEWVALPQRRSEVELDAFVIMPNHFHGLLLLHPPTQPIGDALSTSYALVGSLSAVIGSFKAGVSREINRLRGQETQLWQRSFHDRIMRDEKELNAVRRYIAENPANWPDDQLHPTHSP